MPYLQSLERQTVNTCRFFDPEEYILADKAYGLERHIITPYKEPASRHPANTAFNYQLSIPRLKIEHAFGVLKARWPTLYSIPVRITGIDQEKERGHTRVLNWTIACVVLHNILHGLRDNWLEEVEEEGIEPEAENDRLIREEEANTEAKRAGVRRRTELRDLVTLLEARH